MTSEPQPTPTQEPPVSMAMRVAAVRELAARAKVRSVIETTFETVPRDTRFCVRRLEVVQHVSRALGIRVINNKVFARVERVVRDMGWEPIKNGNRSLYRCARRKDHDLDEALFVSGANRRDPRVGDSAAVPGERGVSVSE